MPNSKNIKPSGKKFTFTDMTALLKPHLRAVFPGLRFPASISALERASYPAGRSPNSSFLFPPLALGLRLLLFLQPLGGALKKQNAALASPPFICRWQQSAPLQSSPLLPKGEPLAYRTAFCQTPKVYSDVKDSALLQRAAASEQASLSSCCESP